MDSTMESATTETKTYKEGQLIKGKDFIRLESPLVLPSKNTPLLTNAQDLVGAINELFTSGTGANGAFRAVFDDNAGVLTIVVQEGEKYADYQFGYEYTDYSDEITTQTVVNGEKVKTTRSFSKRIVTLLFNDSGAVLLVTDYNADSGVILGYTDGSGEAVHTSEWRSEYESVMTQSQGASSVAIAWCIARNLEQSASLTEEKQAYKDGLKIGVEGGADITEEYEKDGNGIRLTTDGDGAVSEPFIGNLTDGIYCVASDGSYVRMWLDTNYTASATGITVTGRMVYDAYDANGVLLDTYTTTGYSGWGWHRDMGYGTIQVDDVQINGPYVTCVHVEKLGDTTQYHNQDWSPKFEPAIIMSSAVRITNIPPDVNII